MTEKEEKNLKGASTTSPSELGPGRALGADAAEARLALRRKIGGASRTESSGGGAASRSITITGAVQKCRGAPRGLWRVEEDNNSDCRGRNPTVEDKKGEGEERDRGPERSAIARVIARRCPSGSGRFQRLSKAGVSLCEGAATSPRDWRLPHLPPFGRSWCRLEGGKPASSCGFDGLLVADRSTAVWAPNCREHSALGSGRDTLKGI